MQSQQGLVDLEGTMSSISSERTMSQATAATVSPWTRPAVAGAVLLVMVIVMFFDFFRRQFLWGITESEDWGHTLVVPVIAGYFIYLRRKELLAQPFKTTWFGLVLVLLGVAWYLECTIGIKTLQNHNFQGFGVYLTLNGLALLFCGWRAMKWLWFPLAYMFVFGQKMPVSLMNLATYPMQDITARGAHVALNVFLDVDRQGNTINIFHDGKNIPLNIAEACSGMRMLMAFLALGVAMAYIGFKRNWQRVLLVMMAVPTAIFVNILRVMTLGFLSLIDPELAAGDAHAFIGLLWLVPAFFIFLGIMWIIGNLVTEQAAPKKLIAKQKAVA
jgi:exosortase